MIYRKSFFIILFTLFISFFSFAQVNTSVPTAADRGLAAEEFRRGVQAYYRGSFNDAILQFEKALSYLPNENLIIDWLGKAYYRSGIEGAALTQWQYALDNGYGGLLLQNRIEIVSQRRITGSDIDSSARYTDAGSFLGIRNNELQFAQPISILPNNDGSCWVLAYTSNELLRIDINGTIISRIRGPITGFDRPMDLVRLLDGRLLVTENAGNRVSFLDKNGSYLSSFGTTGLGVGGLIGPQYAAQSDDGRIYITDYGNARVSVFGSDGTPLFVFGTSSPSFSGFKSPTGIAIYDGIVYVADSVLGAMYKFDLSGNYLGVFVPPESFSKPEAIRKWGEYLIVCDTNKVLLVNIADGSITEKASTGNSPSLITCAIPDSNGNLLVSDFKTNEIYIMAKMTELVGGLFVQIERVFSDNFPQILLEVSVQNRNREPVVGLKEVNFLVTEESRPAALQALTGSANENNICDVAIIIDRSNKSAQYNDAIETAVKDIATAMKSSGRLKIISASDSPTLEYDGNPSGGQNFTISNLSAPVSSTAQLDLAIRLAANNLINGEKKRAIIMLTGNTSVSRNAFSRYGLSDLSAYLNNNSINFLTVSLSQNAIPAEISYITSETSGFSYYIFRPQGISSIIDDIISIPSGLYQLSYTSSLPTNFGQAYLPVEIEAYLFNRSGRDETGYFAPLQ